MNLAISQNMYTGIQSTGHPLNTREQNAHHQHPHSKITEVLRVIHCYQMEIVTIARCLFPIRFDPNQVLVMMKSSMKMFCMMEKHMNTKQVNFLNYSYNILGHSIKFYGQDVFRPAEIISDGKKASFSALNLYKIFRIFLPCQI